VTNPAVIITGMHRSGTSLLASFLARAGVDVGRDLFPPDAHNRRGYFEDREILELQTAMLHSCCAPGETGFLDWGWTWGERLDRSRLAEFHPRAAELATARAAAGGTWGWKDPRTSLLLDVWHGLLPAARYVLVYRSPWEVMRSVARLPVAPLESRPDIGLRAWAFYNRHLLAFYRAHAERCLLLPIDALLADPEALLEGLRDKLGLALPALGSGRAMLDGVVDPELLLRLDGGPALPALLERLFPEVAELWRGLEEEADLHAGRPAAEAHAVAVRAERPLAQALSVLVPCRDDGDLLAATLARLMSLSLLEACEVLVVDAGSTDPYALEIFARLPAAGFGVSTVAGGRAALLNAGMRAAGGRCVLVVPVASRPRPEFVARALDVFDREPRVGVVYGDPPPAAGPPESRRVLDLNVGWTAWPHLPSPPNPLAACLMLRREVWAECGGYDDSMDGGYEDWDLLLSAAERGWLSRYVPEAVFEAGLGTGAPFGTAPLPDVSHRALLERVAAKHPVLVDSRLPHRFVEQESRWLAEVEGSRRLEHEASACRAEIERWRRHVGFMEGTRAWKLRAAILRLRHRLRGTGERR